MSRSLDLRNLLMEISNLDVYNPDSIPSAMYLLLKNFETHPDFIEGTLNSLADYFRKNQFISELLTSAVNRIQHNASTLELEYPVAIRAFNALGDKAIYGPAPTDVDNLISKIEAVSKEPDMIALAPGITMDIIRQWLINMQPASQYVGFVIKTMERFQKSFEYNPIRLAIINKAFALLTDQSARNSNLLGWLAYSLAYTPKIYKAGESGSTLNDVIPELDELCSRLDTIDRFSADADASAMLSIAKWIHIHVSKDISPVKLLFNALSERYRDDEPMLIVLNTAIKSIYELGGMTDDPGILTLVGTKPLTIGPAQTECETLAEQLEFWLADKDTHGAYTVLSSWSELHNRLIKLHPEIKTTLFDYLETKFKTNELLSSELKQVFELANLELNS